MIIMADVDMDIDPQICPHPEQRSQSEPISSEQILNPAGGYVYQIDDNKRLGRFLCLGTELGCYKANSNHKKFSRSEVQCIDRLIATGKGIDAVSTIKAISCSGRACKQNPTLYALAVCARSNDKMTKRAAYSIVNDVCRIPTHLFQFNKYCTEISGASRNSGWGRAHRRAISEWYTKYEKSDRDPVDLARHITKYIRRCGWSHKDLIRKAHVRSRNKAVRICLQYALGKEMEIPSDKISADVNSFLQAVKSMKKFNGPEYVDSVCGTIVDCDLNWQHVPNTYLKDNVQVWSVLIRTMPLTAMIRHLGKLTSLGMFSGQNNKFYEDLVAERLGEDIVLTRAKIHPMSLLIAMKHYNKGLQTGSLLQWTPNQRIAQVLLDAFIRLTTIIPKKDRRCLMAVSVGENMQKPICGSTIEACEAAAAMVYSTVQSQDVDVILFTNKIEESYTANIDKQDTLESINSKVKEIRRGAGDKEDLSVLFKWAAERKTKYDAIVVFTDSLTSCGLIHPTESLKQYMQYLTIQDYRFVVVSMTSDKYTIAAPDNVHNLDVVGFDTFTPGIIMDFINQGSEVHNEPDHDVFLHEDEEYPVVMRGISVR